MSFFSPSPKYSVLSFSQIPITASTVKNICTPTAINTIFCHTTGFKSPPSYLGARIVLRRRLNPALTTDDAILSEIVKRGLNVRPFSPPSSAHTHIFQSPPGMPLSENEPDQNYRKESGQSQSSPLPLPAHCHPEVSVKRFPRQ